MYEFTLKNMTEAKRNTMTFFPIDEFQRTKLNWLGRLVVGYEAKQRDAEQRLLRSFLNNTAIINEKLSESKQILGALSKRLLDVQEIVVEGSEEALQRALLTFHEPLTFSFDPVNMLVSESALAPIEWTEWEVTLQKIYQELDRAIPKHHSA